jgi:hypothetical protein
MLSACSAVADDTAYSYSVPCEQTNRRAFLYPGSTLGTADQSLCLRRKFSRLFERAQCRIRNLNCGSGDCSVMWQHQESPLPHVSANGAQCNYRRVRNVMSRGDEAYIVEVKGGEQFMSEHAISAADLPGARRRSDYDHGRTRRRRNTGRVALASERNGAVERMAEPVLTRKSDATN